MPADFSSTSAPTYYGGLVSPMKWCGVDHPHGPHTWVMASGMTGFYASCPGSSCGCRCAPADTAPATYVVAPEETQQ